MQGTQRGIIMQRQTHQVPGAVRARAQGQKWLGMSAVMISGPAAPFLPEVLIF